jgi:hypothetical protein
MDDDFNPFPAYPVVRLNAEASRIGQDTILTPAIVESRERLKRYEQQWLNRKSDSAQKIEESINAVRGDYGTGKTHLLLDATAHLQDALIASYPDLKIIRAACLETDNLNWFRSSIGPQLNPAKPSGKSETGQGFIERLMIRLYAEAGRNVASVTKLTEGAVATLMKEPAAIRMLVKENLLNVTAVEEEFSRLLRGACQGKGMSEEGITVSEDVRRALAATVWPDTVGPALRWLAAGPLRESERSELRLSGNLSNDEDAAGVLIALAAIHQHLEIPFVLIIDELEHLTRYDKSRQANGNINWLKRLLERLAAHRVLVFVSGHWHGWEVKSDFLDRFKQLGPIELVKLTAEDVLRIVRARVPNLSAESFSLPQAEAVARNSNGNIRRVLTLCLLLFRETDGFRTPITPEHIEHFAGQIAKRISPEAATANVRAILEHEGLSVREQSVTGTGIMFDLIGSKDDQVQVVVELEHAVHQVDLYDAAKVFLDRVEEVFNITPDVVACFIADGNIDDKLLTLLNATRRFKLLWYDLTKPDVMTLIADDLRAYLRGGVGGASPTDARVAELNASKNQNEELMAQLELRIKAASADANAGLVTQLQDQRNLVEQQLARLNDQLSRREADMRTEFLGSLKQQVEELDAKRNAELQRLYERLEAERQKAPSEREEEVLKKQEGEDSPKLHATYTELTRPPSLGMKLRMALSGSQLVMIISYVAAGVALFFSSDVIADAMSMGRQREYVVYKIMFSIMGLLTSLSGVLLIWMRLTKVETFLNYSARTLREIYIRSPLVQDLVRADNILHDSLETFGLIQWKDKADVRLWDEFEPMLGQPPEHVIEARRRRLGKSEYA